jgi:hypothetical protein
MGAEDNNSGRHASDGTAATTFVEKKILDTSTV